MRNTENPRRRARPAATRAVAATIVLFLLARAAPASDHRPWMFLAEAGRSSIHDDDTSSVGALRLARRVGRSDRYRVNLGLVAAAYVVLDAGVEAGLCEDCRVVPFLGAGVGLLGEDEFVGPALRVTAGVDIGLGPRAGLRLSGQLGTHGGQRGPHLVTVGLSFRFGRPR